MLAQHMLFGSAIRRMAAAQRGRAVRLCGAELRALTERLNLGDLGLQRGVLVDARE